jgi:uncharacterized membrane protein (UPF0127 family)
MQRQPVKIINTTRNTILGDKVNVAQTSLARMVGLLGKRGLQPGAGLLIVPSQGVHTIAMRFPIDVIFLDHHWRVIHLQPAMPPYRMTGVHWKARSVLELPVGAIAGSETAVGDVLNIEE